MGAPFLLVGREVAFPLCGLLSLCILYVGRFCWGIEMNDIQNLLDWIVEAIEFERYDDALIGLEDLFLGCFEKGGVKVNLDIDYAVIIPHLMRAMKFAAMVKQSPYGFVSTKMLNEIRDRKYGHLEEKA